MSALRQRAAERRAPLADLMRRVEMAELLEPLRVLVGAGRVGRQAP